MSKRYWAKMKCGGVLGVGSVPSMFVNEGDSADFSVGNVKVRPGVNVKCQVCFREVFSDDPEVCIDAGEDSVPQNCPGECVDIECHESPSGGIGDCNAVPFCEQTLVNPYNVQAFAHISGGVDDELIVNGVIVNAGCCVFVNCNGAHNVNYSLLVAPLGSIVIEAGDNHGSSTGYNLKVCWDPVYS